MAELLPSSSPPVSGGLDALYAAYADMVYRLALIRTRNPADAEDITQEVFLRYLRKTPSFETAGHQKAWLITVTVNCSKTLLTTAFRRHSAPEDAAEGSTSDEMPDDTVYKAVAELPEKYRTAVHLFYYEGYPVGQIASMMHSTESTVKSWLFRARGMLRETLKGAFDDV